MLKTIKPKSASEQVFDQLRDLIYKGRLKPGERMAPERELAQRLGVSRPTVRDALKKLVTMGLIEQRQGQGTFVRQPVATGEGNFLATMLEDVEVRIDDLLDVRMALECHAAATAAQRATWQDVRALSACLKDIASETEAGRLGAGEDVAFHMTIAFATKNPVHIRIMKNLHDLLHQSVAENLRHLSTNPANTSRIAGQHANIYDAIRIHDEIAAFEAMKKHLSFVQEFFAEHGIPPPATPAKFTNGQ